MLSKIARFIDETHLLDSRNSYLVALSGGADSVCLLLSLLRLGYKVDAVHCNFQLRGVESSRDEKFVIGLCEEKGVKLHLIHFDTIAYAQLHHVSIEMAARQLRYSYFERLREDIGAADICVAHHQDDSVETLFLNLLRGTGLRGLTGIHPRQGHIVRPLLGVSRSEILEWLKHEQQPFVTDSSNLESEYQRNFLRNNILAVLKERMPHVDEQVLTTARRVSEALKVYDSAMDEALGRLVIDDSIDISALNAEPSSESILFEWLTPKGFSPATIEQVARSACHAGQSWTSATQILFVHQDRLVVRPLSSVRPTLCVPETGTYRYDETTVFRFSLPAEWTLSRQADCVTLDLRRLKFPLVVRPIAEGDRFRPLGMKGSKLVSDYLTDRHVSVYDKRRQLVVTDAEGRIIWLVGHRPDENYRIGPDTAKVLAISVSTV